MVAEGRARFVRVERAKQILVEVTILATDLWFCRAGNRAALAPGGAQRRSSCRHWSVGGRFRGLDDRLFRQSSSRACVSRRQRDGSNRRAAVWRFKWGEWPKFPAARRLVSNLAQALQRLHERFRKSQRFCFSLVAELLQRAGILRRRVNSMASATGDDPLGWLACDLGDQIEVMVVVEEWHVVDGSRRGDHHVWGRHSVLAAFCEHPLNLQREL